MKANSTQILNILKNDTELGFFLLVRLSLNSEYLLTTLPHDVTFDGNIYVSERCLVSLEPPRASTVVDRQAYTLRLSGLDPDMMAEINTGVINGKVEIRLGFTNNNSPYTRYDRTIHVYSGYVSHPQRSVSGEDMSISLELTSPLADLDAISTLFTTKDSMEQYAPGDTSFDKISEGGAAVSLAWGKEK